jgi:hypothetical protein
MAEIETLTEHERELLEEMADQYVGYSGNEDAQRKALRVIDAQAKRIEELEALLAHLQEDLHKNLFLRDEARSKARQRISELEAQVLSADTVSKAEYQAMVQQRDTLRQERNEAREEVGGLCASIAQAVSDLEELRKNPGQSWWLEEVLFELRPGAKDGRALPDAGAPDLAFADRVLRHARALAELVGHVSGQSPPATEELQGAIDYARYEGRDAIAADAATELAALLARIADLEAREVNAGRGSLPPP